LGSTQTFTVAGSDADGDVLTYTWRVDASVVGGNTDVFVFTAEAPGLHTVNVTVSDGSLAVSREWSVTVASPSLLLTLWPFPILANVVLCTVLVLWWMRGMRRREQPPPPPK
jgi:hypothetical protein